MSVVPRHFFSRRTLLAAGGLALLSGCDRMRGLLGQGGQGKPSFRNIDITGADYARNFVLTDHHGRQRTIADFKGKLVVIFFGYTQCPDVCPSTMAELAALKKALGADGDRLQVLFVTVDPARDTPAVLEAYMGNFDPSFLALFGSPEQTAAVGSEFKVYYSKVAGKTPGSYTMDHTAGSYVFDTAGRIRLFVRHGTGPDALAFDLRQLLRT